LAVDLGVLAGAAGELATAWALGAKLAQERVPGDLIDPDSPENLLTSRFEVKGWDH
jgi:hypothetical protein